MKRYIFQGITPSGHFRKGLIHSPHKEKVWMFLQKRRIMPLSVSRLWQRFPGSKSLDQKNALIFFVHLEQAYLAGLSLLRATRLLGDEMRGKWPLILHDIGDQLEEGTSFSKAVGSHPEFSDFVLLSLLQVGEETGAMGKILSSITTYLRKSQETRERLREALRYPLVILVVLTFTVVVLLETLVPSMVEISDMLHLQHPGAVKFWAAMARVLDHDGETIALSTGVVFLGACALWKKLFNRFVLFQRLWLKIPLWGSITMSTTWGHFFEAWRLMIVSGIPIANAFQKSVEIVAHPVLKDFLEKSKKHLLEGEKIATLFFKAPGMKAYTYQLLVVGEKTGRFAVVLQQVAYLHEREALRLQEKLLTLLQPLCLGGLGLLILWMAMGTLLPLYEHLPEISGGTL